MIAVDNPNIVVHANASDIAREVDYLDIKFTVSRKKKGKRGKGFQCHVSCEEIAKPSSECKCGIANTNTRIVGGNVTESDDNALRLSKALVWWVNPELQDNPDSRTLC